MQIIYKYSICIVIICNIAMWGQLNKIKSSNAQGGKIQIGKLWAGTDIYPYITNLGYLGYLDYPGGSEDYYVEGVSLILSGSIPGNDNILVDLGSNSSNSGGSLWLFSHDILNEPWDTLNSDSRHVFWEADADFGGNPWQLRMNTKLRCWSYDKYDDFILVQYTFTNYGGVDISDFFMASSLPANCGEKTVESRNLDDIAEFNKDSGLAFMRDNDGDGGLSPYWVGQCLIKAPPVNGSSDDPETDVNWNRFHAYSWDNIPTGTTDLYSRIRNPVAGDTAVPQGEWSIFSGIGPFTIKAGGDVSFIICYAYGKDEEIYENLANARYLVNNDYIIPEDEISPPPPSITAEVNGLNIKLKWFSAEAESEPDFAGYRLYKSDLSWNGPWRLIYDDSKPSDREYVDRAQVGYNNYYAVTAFDLDGNESTLWSPICRTREGITATTSPGDDMGKIKVIPNPYLGSATWEQRDYENKILFSYLPPSCKISIFSLSGDLVRELYHNIDGDPTPDAVSSGDESWDLISRNNQSVASGLYIFVVETPSGKTKIGKFAIIKGEK
jgi:hypothetical protein